MNLQLKRRVQALEAVTAPQHYVIDLNSLSASTRAEIEQHGINPPRLSDAALNELDAALNELLEQKPHV